jgi:membrane protein
VLSWPPVAAARGVLARYDAAGGGLLAGGLAYAALVAIVPAVLLAAGLVGLLVNDAARRSEVIGVIASVFPPLRDLVEAVLAEAGRDAGALGLVGAATLAWGASRFVLAFAEAIARVTGRAHRRNAIVRNVAAIIVVLLLPAAIVAGATLAGLLSFLDVAAARGVVRVVGDTVQLVLGLLPPIATILVVGLVYRTVPTPAPRWGAIWPPAVVVGIALTILLRVFVFLAPRLIGAAALLGTIATVFAALAWLALTFQAILLGGAWVGEQDSRGQAAG